ncbi:MAG: hypothetical protein JWM80_684 [Cyanobacteria bacterium RYN_339]|nr:hypothetical protein [Cyanobacteria bacterium RYN_339]
MRTRLALLLVTAAIASGCAKALMAPEARTGTLEARRQTVVGVEQLVSKDRIAGNLAVLAGKAPAADGRTIAERGSVEGREQTRQYISAQLAALGYAVERAEYRKNGQNLVARLTVEGATDTLLVGAHLDSVHNAGADDNGSGSTVVLEAAAALRELPGRKQNIIFAWFDEEELGLVGSYAMARQLQKQGQKLTSAHTIDMIGWDSDKDKAIEIERPDGVLWDYYQMVNRTHGLNLPLKRTNSGDTDHVAFRASGFTSVGLCEEWVGGDTTPHYHSRTDTLDTIDFDYMASSAQLLVATLGDLARGVPAPAHVKLLPHTDFPGRPRPHHH